LTLFWLKPAGVRQVMERIKRETGIKVLYCHQLRHMALTLMVKGEMDLHSIKRMAGHASVTTTEAYLAFSQEWVLDTGAANGARRESPRWPTTYRPVAFASHRFRANHIRQLAAQ
jgi:integrase